LAAFDAGFVMAVDALLARCDPTAPDEACALDADLHTMEAR
jgi:hypothetical protein